MNNSKKRHDGGAYRRMCTMIAAHAKPARTAARPGKGNVYAGWN